MSTSGWIAALLLAAGVLAGSRRRSREACALAAILLTIVPVVGATYGATGDLPAWLGRDLSPLVALALYAGSFALLLVPRDGSVRRAYGGAGRPGRIAAGLLAVAIAIPWLVGWVRWQGERAGLFSTTVGLTLYTVSNMLVFGALTWLTTSLLARKGGILARTQARFARISESGIVGMIVVDTAGLVSEANDAFLHMIGATRDDLAGGLIRGSYLTPPEWRAADAHARAQLAAGGTSTPWEKEFLRKDGSRVPVLVSVAVLETPFMLCLVSDLTRQKADHRFRDLLESAPDAMVIVDQHRRIVIVNAQTERLFGYTRAELIGEQAERLLPDRYRGFFEGAAARANDELTGLRKDGTEVPIAISLSPVQTDDGALVSVAVRDITERKLVDARLQETSRLKSEFLANMSHELRTPLNAIIGFAELMHGGRVGPMAPDHVEYLGDILASSRHLLQLVNDVLDLAKVESGKLEVHPEPTDLPRLVAELRDVLRGLATSKRIRIETVIDPTVTQVVVDPGRVKQILYNFLSNAIKFTPDEGTVTITVGPAASPSDFRLDVADTGIGIAPGDLGKLFVEFQQLDGSMTKRYAGTGLGLALTKRLVEGHGGHVEVVSTLGAGSTFSAILPRG